MSKRTSNGAAPRGSRVKKEKKGKAHPTLAAGAETPAEAQAIVDWINAVKFKRAVFGGLDEADVWKRLAELNELYEQALTAERLRYDALLAAQKSDREVEP